MCACTQFLLNPRDLDGHLSRHPHLPTPLPERSSWFSWSHVPGCWCHMEFRDTGRRRLLTCAAWAGQSSGMVAHPAHATDWSRISRRGKHVYLQFQLKTSYVTDGFPSPAPWARLSHIPHWLWLRVGFHILGRAASQTLHSRTVLCACVERGFVTDLLLTRCKLRRAGRGLLFTFPYSHQWRIILEAFSWLGARLLSTSFAVAVSPAVLLGCTLIPGPGRTDSHTPARESRRAEGIRVMLPGKGRCHPLAVHLASNGSCWPHCAFHPFNWSPVSTQIFPLTELESIAGQNISTLLWPPSIEHFPVPEYGLSESFL